MNSVDKRELGLDGRSEDTPRAADAGSDNDRQRDEVLRRMWNMPPEKHSSVKKRTVSQRGPAKRKSG